MKNARIRVEQETDPLLQALRRKLRCNENDHYLLKTAPKVNRLLIHDARIRVKDGNRMH